MLYIYTLFLKAMLTLRCAITVEEPRQRKQTNETKANEEPNNGIILAIHKKDIHLLSSLYTNFSVRLDRNKAWLFAVNKIHHENIKGKCNKNSSKVLSDFQLKPDTS